MQPLHELLALELSDDEERSVRSFAFVSGKPLILVANLGEDDLGGDAATTESTERTQNDGPGCPLPRGPPQDRRSSAHSLPTSPPIW